MTGRHRGGEDPPQLQIWDAAREEFEAGSLIEGDAVWEIHVLVERAASGLCRGSLSFRNEDERFDTAPVILEEDEEAVVRRVTELPPSTLRQFLAAVRG